MHLLRKGDVDSLLQLERQSGHPRSDLLIAAATLAPNRAVELLLPALKRYNGEYDGYHRCRIAAALAELDSERGINAAVDWFFNEKPQRGTFPGDRVLFLEQLESRVPGTHRIVVERVIRDERLGTLGPPSTRHLLTRVEGYLGRRLADEEQVRDSYSIDEFQRDRKFEHLAEWQRLLGDTLADWR